MTKPGPKKVVRQQKKHKQQIEKRKHRQTSQRSSFSSPFSPTAPLGLETFGQPAAGARWLGRRIASLVRRRD